MARCNHNQHQSSVSQAAAVAALNGDPSFLAERNAVFKSRRDLVVAKLNAMPELMPNPRARFTFYPSCAAIGKKTPDGKTIANDGDFVATCWTRRRLPACRALPLGLNPLSHFLRNLYRSEDAMARIASAVRP